MGCGATAGRGGTEHGYGSGGSYGWGGPLTLSPSPISETGDGSHKELTATCSLYWGGPSLLSPSPVGRSGSGANYEAAATRLLTHVTHTEARIGNEDLHVSVITKPASFFRSPRDIAFRSDTKPSYSI